MKLLSIIIVLTISIIVSCHAFEVEEGNEGHGLNRFLESIANRQLQKRPRKRGECEVTCRTDKDCVKGLLCANKNKKSLLNNGLNKRTAYCSNNPITGRDDSVCFDPNKINTNICEPIPIGNVCDITIDTFCFGSPYCCRQITNVTTTGDNICSSQKCFWSDECICVPVDPEYPEYGSQWVCYISYPSPSCVQSSQCSQQLVS